MDEIKKFDFWKFTNGFFPTSGERVGKLLYYAIIIIIGLTIYHKVFLSKTMTTVIQKPHQVIVQSPKQDSFILLKLWKIKIISIE